jgi:hypothetical protein
MVGWQNPARARDGLIDARDAGRGFMHPLMEGIKCGASCYFGRLIAARIPVESGQGITGAGAHVRLGRSLALQCQQ